MFVPGAPTARVTIGVVAYGDSDRLRRCLDSLVGHTSTVPFDIVCVINPNSRSDPVPTDLPPGIVPLRPDGNLGWAGGLHLARTVVTGEYFVWAQDDMVVADGWLDALVRVADAHPEAGGVGSVEVDSDSRRPNGFAGGYADPPDRVGLWNLTDVLRDGARYEGGGLDWLTSKGLLTRTAAWDDVGGADPALFPLNHVDKDYSIHLRAHGWTLLLAPDAQLIHEKHRSGPGQLRVLLAHWQEPEFDLTWGPVAAALRDGATGGVPHRCDRVPAPPMAEVERVVGRQASRMLVPFASSLAGEIDAAMGELESTRRTLSWRITAPLRGLKRALVRPR